MVTLHNIARRANSFPTITNGLFKRKMSASTVMDKFKLPSRHEPGKYNVWIEFGQLAVTTRALNLGQGFPDYDPPAQFSNFLSQVASEKDSFFNQYTRGFGHVRLVRALSKLYSKLNGRQIDPMNEILVTVGAYEALYCAIQSNIEKGDEAIIIEPFFDCYEPMVRVAGGTPRFISLRNTKPDASVPNANDWRLDADELASAFNAKTKLIIVNTPHNPLGKVFDYGELKTIADLAKKHNVLVISDEVYEWLVYEPTKHIRIATLPDMWERTVTIGSAGKTFSMTGWKLGWAYGPANFIGNMCVVHQNSIYTCATTVQEAVARSFEQQISYLDTPDSYFRSLPGELNSKKHYLFKILQDNGFDPIMPEGGYFMIANWAKNYEGKLDLSSETDKYKDFRFVKWLAKNVKLQGIPFSVFYNEANKSTAESYLRFCFFKKDETLQNAEKIILKWSSSLSEVKSKV